MKRERLEKSSPLQKRPKQKKKITISDVKRWLPLYLMMLPGLVYILFNNYVPMLGVIIAFKKINFQKGILGSDWVGLKNFKFLFSSQDAWIITRNTLLYNLGFIVLNTTLGIILAIFICEVVNRKLKKLYQSTILLPFLMSTVIVSYIVFAFLSTENGLLNKAFIEPMGGEAISWYSQPKYWPFILTLVNVWKGIGYGCLIYISSINGIPRDYYEAAALDGAGKFRQTIHITLPALVPSIVTLTLLGIGRIFYSDFGLFFQIPMNSGPLFETTNVIDTYVYRALLERNNIGQASAAGLYQSLVGFVLVLTANLIVRKVSKENALF